MSKGTRFLGVSAIAVLALTACAPGGGSQQAAEQQAVNIDPAKIGKATITVQDTIGDAQSPRGRWMLAVQSAFMKKYPDIKVNRVTDTFDNVNKTLPLKLRDNSAPDIVPANNGWQGIGTLSKAGLIMNLDGYAKAYKWRERLAPTIVRQHEVTTDGKSIGTGALYGMPPAQGAFITVYYNRAKLSGLNLSVPQSFKNFEAALAAAKAAGEIPLQFGALDNPTPPLLALQDVYGDAKKISDFVYGARDGKLSATGLPEAAATFQKWSKAGYLPSYYAGINGGDASQKFVDGDGVFFFYYSDSIPFKDISQSNKFGSFLLPSRDGSPVNATGSANGNFSIAANSKHADAAALFLDYLSSPAAGEAAVKEGIMPALGTYGAPSGQAYLGDEIRSVSEMESSPGGYIPYFDWASPTMFDTLVAQTQLLLASKATPEQLVFAAQADYDTFKAKR